MLVLRWLYVRGQFRSLIEVCGHYPSTIYLTNINLLTYNMHSEVKRLLISSKKD